MNKIHGWAWFVAWWVVLGVASSIGLGTGLHTGALYLMPYIVQTVTAAIECRSLDFAQEGAGLFPFPLRLSMAPSHLLPEQPGNSGFLSNASVFLSLSLSLSLCVCVCLWACVSAGESAFECRSMGAAGAVVSFWAVYSKVSLACFLWGAGTAIGELPPYFVAKAGACVDDSMSSCVGCRMMYARMYVCMCVCLTAPCISYASVCTYAILWMRSRYVFVCVRVSRTFVLYAPHCGAMYCAAQPDWRVSVWRRSMSWTTRATRCLLRSASST